ncbi:MAG: tRNA (adenosine(37)-N6)-threonylcarbamoyltransferase complex dimerization subunit type 1 TsaB [Acidobacteriota bacterium]|nr:tRNA (adenosine(37)-N6)-threonylcarbamoyltransferase complex dimerization subunit type 1 TsaB [Acidobacteriota bacterium]
MLILAIDTSWKQGSVALARGDGRSFELIEMAPVAGGTFSAQLIPEISALLAKHKIGKDEIEGFGAASGPGSFTGLRVGLAAVKALAEVLKKPVAAVSVLEALAVASGATGRVIAALDAGRAEAYVGEYELGDGGATRVQESLVGQEELAALVAGYGKATAVTPDEVIAKLLDARKVVRPQSDAIARLALRKIAAGETVAPEELDANYIRRSDAEIFAKP